MLKVRDISKVLVFFAIVPGVFGLAKDTDAQLKAHYEPDVIYLEPSGDYAEFNIQVNGPGAYQYTLKYEGGTIPVLETVDADGNSLPDGTYTYQITASPIVDMATREAMLEARAMQTTLTNPPRGFVRSGHFTILNGEFVNPFEAEDFSAAKNGDEEPTNIATDADAGRDVIHLDDTIITGSLCVGFDCVNGESFAFDTLRLKENNLRVHFQDTSASASFPTNDWRIVINDTTNGGANYFAIEDSEAGRYPFRVEASAPNHSLYVEDSGQVGLGTNTPVVELHIANGDSPTMRLEQTGTSGFTPQTWDVAGNETNFFIRDATNASVLPFRIRPGAGTNNAIYVDIDGSVGLGDTTPDASLDVELGTVLVDNDGSGGDALPYGLKVHNTGSNFNTILENTSDNASTRSLLQIKNKGLGKIQLHNSIPGQTWSIGTQNDASFIVYSDGTAGAQWYMPKIGGIVIKNQASTSILDMDDTGNATFTGAVAHTSDRNMKENFAQEDPLEVLDKVSALSITSWNYIADGQHVRHMGPMAQDFYAAFGLGQSELTISSGDVSSIALISIQALNASLKDEVAAKDAEISDLREQLADQEARLRALEKALLK